jgi:ribonuclease Z
MKNKRKSVLFSFLVFILVVLSTGWIVVTFFPQKIVSIMINPQLERASKTPDLLGDKESIQVITVGTSSPMPGERAQTGTAIFVNGYFFMFDVGTGVVQKSENLGLPLTNINGIFLTHYHSDHMMDLPNIINRSWVMGRTNDLHIYGPDSLTYLVNAANAFLGIENMHRVDHHGPEIMDITKAKGISNEYHVAQNSSVVVFQKDGITITAFDVDHEPIDPAVGYVIEYKGKKVVISGDTKEHALLEKIAQDCDLLIHEVMLMSFQEMLEKELSEAGQERNTKIIHDIQDYHTSTTEVAALAERANVKKLVLNHFAPAPDNMVIKNMYLNELKGFSGPIHLANDGDKFIVK